MLQKSKAVLYNKYYLPILTYAMKHGDKTKG